MWLNYLNGHKGHFFCIDTLDLKCHNLKMGQTSFPCSLHTVHYTRCLLPGYSSQFMKLLTVFCKQSV